MHHGGEETDAAFRPARRLQRFWRRADRRGRLRAVGAGGAALLVGAAGLCVVLGAVSPASAPMAFGEYAAAVSAGTVAEVLVRPQDAEVVLRNGERRQVRAPLEWQPMARLAEAGIALRRRRSHPG